MPGDRKKKTKPLRAARHRQGSKHGDLREVRNKKAPEVPCRTAAYYWGVIGPRMMPCLFGSKNDAEEGVDFDERVGLFLVEEVQVKK